MLLHVAHTEIARHCNGWHAAKVHYLDSAESLAAHEVVVVSSDDDEH